MQTTSAPMAWLFLQENEQVQYLQKIAAQKIRLDHIIICLCGPDGFSARSAIFCCH